MKFGFPQFSSVVEIINRVCPRFIIESLILRSDRSSNRSRQWTNKIRFIGDSSTLPYREPHDLCLYIGARKRKRNSSWQYRPKKFLISSIARGRMPTTIFSSHSILYFCLPWTSAVHDDGFKLGWPRPSINKWILPEPKLASILLVEKNLCGMKRKKKKKKRSPDEATTATREIIVLVFSAEFYRRILLNTLITVTEPTTFRVVTEEAYPLPLIRTDLRSAIVGTNDRRQRKDVLSLVVDAVQTRPFFRFYEHRAWVFIGMQSRVCAIRYRATKVVEESRRGCSKLRKLEVSGIDLGWRRGDGGKGTDSCDVQRL